MKFFERFKKKPCTVDDLKKFYFSPGTMKLPELYRIQEYFARYADDMILYIESNDGVVDCNCGQKVQNHLEAIAWYIQRAEGYKKRSNKLKSPRDWPRS